jgi:hypothetical protein
MLARRLALMLRRIPRVIRVTGLKNGLRHNRFLPFDLTVKTTHLTKEDPVIAACTPQPDPALSPDIALLKHINDPANWGLDRFGRSTILLKHHRVTLHRIGPQGSDRWTWSCERLDTPGIIWRWVKTYPLCAAHGAVALQLWADLVDGGTAREDVFRRMAASAEKKWPKTRRPWPPAREPAA